MPLRSLLKKRPYLKLLAPPEVRPGANLAMTLVLDVERPVDIDAIESVLMGTERVTIGAGKHAQTSRVQLLRLPLQQLSARELKAGVLRVPLRARLPAELPPSYRGHQAVTEYYCRVRVRIPWWPDARGDFEIPVVYPPHKVETQPHLVSSSPRGHRGTEPHLEASLSSLHLVPGHVLRGSVALFNVAYNRYHAVSISIVGSQTSVVGSRRSKVKAFDFTHEIPLAAPVEGQAIPFAIRVPEIPPTATSHRWALAWVVRFVARRRFARDLSVPVSVAVLPRGSRLSNRQQRALPRVGNRRVAAVWKNVAQRLGLGFDGEQLTGKLEGVEVSLRREHRGRQGIYLVATLNYPRLHLAFDAGPREGFSRFFDVASHQLWDEGRHTIAGRHVEQTAAFVKAWLPRRLPYSIVDACDDWIVFEKKGSGQDPELLYRFASWVTGLAKAFPQAVAHIPPPEIFSSRAAASWERAAVALGGRLEKARMAISGSFEGRRAKIVTEWNSTLLIGTRISLRPSQSLPERACFSWLKDAGVPLVRARRGALREHLAVMEPGVDGLWVTRQKLEMSVTAPLRDAELALERLDHLLALERLLARRRGAYR